MFYHSFADEDGLRRSDLVNWYLKEIEKDIESEKELAEKKLLIDKVLDRLIHHVCTSTRWYRNTEYKWRSLLNGTFMRGWLDFIRELKQNSRGRRQQHRQNNKTYCTRQKAHMNMWNKADICACSQVRLQLLHFHAVFKKWQTFQELTSIVSFRRKSWSQRNFRERETYRITKVKMCLVKYEDYGRNIFLPPTLASPSSSA